MSTLTSHAPAKLNLTLRIVRKRKDGFHELDTLMVKLRDLHDTLTFTESDTFRLTCSDPTLPTDGRNLVTKAALAYHAALGTPCRHSIFLEKAIPHAAGLGGGSSDAATTLAGLDALHDHALGTPKLMEIAASLGSDIPFFLGEGAARCTGRGEIISPAENPPPLDVLLLKPAFGVSTPDAYRRWANSRTIPTVPYGEQEIDGLRLINDLERPVFAKHRFLAELKLWLLARPEVRAALLCGSGSTMCAILQPSANPSTLAAAVLQELDPTLWHHAGQIG